MQYIHGSPSWKQGLLVGRWSLEKGWETAAATAGTELRAKQRLDEEGGGRWKDNWPEPRLHQRLLSMSFQLCNPSKNRIAIYELLFKEGVMVAKKDVHMPKHPELADKNVPNLHVMKAMQSLKSRGYVKEQFAWRHFYWYLTNEGIQYLRDYLHLPPEIVPATLRRSRPETGRPRPKGPEGERPARFTRGEADRDTSPLNSLDKAQYVI